MTIAVVVPGRSAGRPPRLIVRWNGAGKRTVVVPGATPTAAADAMFRVDRLLRRRLRGRTGVEAEIAVLLTEYPTASTYGLPDSADPRIVPERSQAVSDARSSDA